MFGCTRHLDKSSRARSTWRMQSAARFLPSDCQWQERFGARGTVQWQLEDNQR
jgi:hypothetical protein